MKGKIFCLMGKSASGKDTVYRLLREKRKDLKKVVLYTTRPVRAGEIPGKDYHFITEDTFLELKKNGKVIESRTYETVHGPWTYATVDDGSISLKEGGLFLVPATLISYLSLRLYFGEDAVCPLYLEVEDGVRLQRALDREKTQMIPKYAELCRRFLADEDDFSAEKLEAAGIKRRYYNDNAEACAERIIQDIRDVCRS